ncbi:MAG: flavin reductase family protein [Gammaproteobacteria bacterium]|nr:flavin reductase family protein [Gammaproteobacteria bacterium]
MNIDLSDLSASRIYFAMTQTLLPRPIAWVLSESANGSYNLAPFSYFNAVCSDPPLVMMSIGWKADGSEKDTRLNIKERNHFVIHIPHKELAEAVNTSAAPLPAGESELDKQGLHTTPFEGSLLPRLTDCRVAYACERYEIHEIGNKRQALILGLVKSIYIDDLVVTADAKGRIKVDAEKIDPLGRLGAGEYVTFGEVLCI